MNFECIRCPGLGLSILQSFIYFVFVLAFMMFMIIINIKKTSESQVSVLFRILVNYAQVLSFTLTMAINIPSPDIIYDIFTPIRSIGQASERMVSFE